MQYELKPFGANLRIALAAAEMTQQGLAEELGMSLAIVNRWCRGKSVPAGDTLVRLARVLDRDAEWFFSEPEGQAA
jgi:transcriptional regulator with XRE-family HTH domain